MTKLLVVICSCLGMLACASPTTPTPPPLTRTPGRESFPSSSIAASYAADVPPSVVCQSYANGVVFVQGKGESKLYYSKEGVLSSRPISKLQETPKQVSLSPDGNSIVYVANNQIWRMDIPDGQPQLITRTTDPKSYPAWSPNGTMIAFLAHGANKKYIIYRMTKDGGEMTVLISGIPNIPVSTLSWAQDGDEQYLMFLKEPPNPGDKPSVFIISHPNSCKEPYCSKQNASGPGTVLMTADGAVLSPDARKLAYVKRGELYLADYRIYKPIPITGALDSNVAPDSLRWVKATQQSNLRLIYTLSDGSVQQREDDGSKACQWPIAYKDNTH